MSTIESKIMSKVRKGASLGMAISLPRCVRVREGEVRDWSRACASRVRVREHSGSRPCALYLASTSTFMIDVLCVGTRGSSIGGLDGPAGWSRCMRFDSSRGTAGPRPQSQFCGRGQLVNGLAPLHLVALGAC